MTTSLRPVLPLLFAALWVSGCDGCVTPPVGTNPFGDGGQLADSGALASCAVHDDCPLGMRCADQGCVEATRSPPVEGCAGDEHCDEGFACAVSTGRCVESPPPSASLPPPADCDENETRLCGTKIGGCEYGVERCVDGAFSGVCEGAVGATDEVCDGVDNDCDGTVDEILGATCFVGTVPCLLQGSLACAEDGSGSLCVVPPSAGESCNEADDNGDGCIDEGFDTGVACAVGQGACRRTGERVCSLDGGGTVCGVTEGVPSAESCNNLDDDCDGVVDNGCDDDGDDYCDAALALVGSPSVCPNTAGSSTQDCNDNNASVHPGAAEVCENNVDENCDGQVSEGCDAPVAVCAPGSIATEPFVAVALDGAASTDGGGGALTYSWQVTSAPAGSTASPAPSTSATPTFTPDLAGEYEVTLTVTNAQGVTDSCVVAVDVIPPASLHVQVVWQEAVGDLDLHVTKHGVNPVGAFFDTTGKDTWWAVPVNDWGTAGSVDGNASLDVDDRAGFGPENTNIDVNPANGTYHVGVHLYCEQDQTSQNQFSGPEGPRHAKVRIYCGGQLVDEIPTGWRTLEKAGDFWVPAKIEWSGNTCSVTRLDAMDSGLKYCRALGGCGATAAYGLTNDCRAERRCDNNAGCRNYEVCLGNGNNKKCYVQSCTAAADCPAGHRCAAEHGNVCAR